MVVLREGMCPGLDEDLVRDLRNADIKTVEDLVSSDTEKLAQKCSVSYKALLAIRRVLLAQHTAFPVSGADLYEELLSSTAILSSGNPRGVAPYKPAAPLLTSPPASNKLCLFTTREEPELTAASRCAAAVQKLGGVSPHLYADAAPRPGDKSSSLDKLLDSGFYTGELTELSGGPGSGKSQVCFAASVHISHHLKQSVVFVDTTGGLTAGRLLQMLEAETSSREEQMEALQRIHVFRLFDVFSLLDCLYGLRAGILQQASVGGGGGSVKAVIVDSVSAVIAPVLGGKQNEGMSLMTQVGGVLKTIAKDFNIAALVTNHVTRSLRGEVQPGLGMSWSHVPRTRILLERVEAASAGCSSLRSATLIKSSRQPCNIRVEFDLQRWSRSKRGSEEMRTPEEMDSA
ncbi:RAD51 -like protein 4 R51H3 [Takifugu flavidus]|uniref:RAD51-like protein 4 R51H3 n=1 Tax=Takifugu flavidus TaxID=433684 RepID=A0A5C6P8F2_9TELE|nr:RAD51 -like protein 4 R51H3 [Takifugu flavidus]